MLSRWFAFILFAISAMIGLGLITGPPTQAAGVVSAVAGGGDTLPVLPARAGALAWIWYPRANADADTLSKIWRAGVPWPGGSGPLVAVDGRGYTRTLVADSARILDRPSGAPLALAGPAGAPTRLVNPATGRVLAQHTI